MSDQRRPRPAPRHAARRRRQRPAASRPELSLPRRRPQRPAGSTSAHGRPGVVRHATERRRRRHAVLVSVLGMAIFLTSGVAWAYRDLDSNIESHDVDDLLGTDRPEAGGDPLDGAVDPAAGEPVNLVLIGSDDRSGENFDIGGGTHEGIRSDTVIVAHISADRERVELISIPRDSWVTIPECELPDGTTSYPQEGKFNGAFQTGGATGDVGYAAACTIRTIESLTDVRMDGFIAVDFNGFVNVVDALGGVPFCVPEAIDDPQAHLELEAGEQVLDGTDALGYARARKSLGDGSDTDRIERQQDLLGATVRHALDQNLLTDGPALYSFLDAATSSVTASSNYASITTLGGLAASLRGMNPEDVTFATVPWAGLGDGANVVWTAEAEELWEAVGNDDPIAEIGQDDGTEADDAAGQDDGTGTDDPAGAADQDTDEGNDEEGDLDPDDAATDDAAEAETDDATAAGVC